MKPNNIDDNSCEATSSSCVIWDGKDIECIKLCNGDSITTVTYALAQKLCDILDQLNVSNYDLGCLVATGCDPIDFKGFINLLIAKLCETRGVESASAALTFGRTGAKTLAQDNNCPDCYVTLAPSFRYVDSASGDLVTESLLQDYVKRVAITVCDLISNINAQTQINKSISDRIGKLESKPTPTFTLPSLYPVCIAPTTELLSLDEFVKLLEKEFCTLSGSIGTSNEVFNVLTTGANLNAQKALGTSGGTLGEISGWRNNPVTLSDSFKNMWLVLLDARSAIRNIQLTCCTTTCDGIAIDFIATLENKILKLFFNGAVPTNLTSCLPTGSPFKISDNSGNYFNVNVDVKGNINNISGVVIDLNSTSLNFADDFKISSITCFTDSDTGSMCQRYLEATVNNNTSCPTINLIPNLTSVAYSFVHTSGTLTYSIELFDSTNTMVQSRSISVSSAVNVTGTFSGLDYGSSYRVRVKMINSTTGVTKTCPFTAFDTLPNPCPAPNSVSVTIQY